jgi:hypothetical protein
VRSKTRTEEPSSVHLNSQRACMAHETGRVSPTAPALHHKGLPTALRSVASTSLVVRQPPASKTSDLQGTGVDPCSAEGLRQGSSCIPCTTQISPTPWSRAHRGFHRRVWSDRSFWSRENTNSSLAGLSCEQSAGNLPKREGLWKSARRLSFVDSDIGSS